jgi:hypothetical protein
MIFKFLKKIIIIIARWSSHWSWALSHRNAQIVVQVHIAKYIVPGVVNPKTIWKLVYFVELEKV